MARIYPICSSSLGNCTFIGTRGNGVLVDAGCSFRALKSALELIDTELSGIEAVFITHEHTDHIKGLEQIMKHTSIPVFASEGTISALRKTNAAFENGRFYDINKESYISAGFKVKSFKTSHDAAESVGYTVDFRGRRCAVCTDTGEITPEAEAALTGCEAVLLESNYDVDMLRRNPKYHPELKRRIIGALGHLSNDACACFAEKLVKSGTTRLILGHLSRENNTPDTAYSCTCGYLQKCGLKAESDFTLDIAPIHTEGRFIAL